MYFEFIVSDDLCGFSEDIYWGGEANGETKGNFGPRRGRGGGRGGRGYSVKWMGEACIP